MMITQTSQGLAGKLLIAMPGVQDIAFRRSVVLVCAHSERGAMGLVINRPAPDMTFRRLMKERGTPVGLLPMGFRIHAGGPVQVDRGFVLHDPAYDEGAETLKISDAFSMTSSRTILGDIAGGNGPEAPMVVMGYAGWGEGQLEDELGRNIWLSADASPSIVFGRHDDIKWERALAASGIGAAHLSGLTGYA